MYRITYTMQDGKKATLNKHMMWSLNEPERAMLYETENEAKAIACTWIKVQMGNELMKYVAIEKV